MIEIYFFSNTNQNISPEIDLSGNEEDFTGLNLKLKDFLESESQQIKFEVDTKANPFPYEKMLGNLTVRKADHPVLVSVIDENELKIEGSIDCLDIFVSNIEYVSGGYHIHYEYYEGNEWISPDSLPLIITSKI